MQPSLNDLRYFVAVAQYRSFTRAADSLRISQPSLSRAIAELERRSGATFFDRSTRSVELTDVGREFQLVAEDILASYAQGLGRFDAFRQGERGSVTVAALPSLAAGSLPETIATFRRIHPHIDVRMREGFHRDLLTSVRNGAADLVLTDEGDDGDDLTSYELAMDPLMAVLPVGSEFGSRQSLTWADLAAATFITVRTGSGIRRLTDLGFETVQNFPKRIFEVDSIGAAAASVAAGLGVTALPRSVASLTRAADVDFRSLEAPVVHRTLMLHTRSRPRLGAAATAFAVHVRSRPLIEM